MLVRRFGLLVVALLFAPPALAAGSDDYAALTALEREGIDLACGKLGDHGSVAWNACLDKQLQALNSLPPKTSMELFKPAERPQVEAFCRPTLTSGPASYYKCVERQAIKLVPPSRRLAAPDAAPPARVTQQSADAGQATGAAALLRSTPQPLPQAGADIRALSQPRSMPQDPMASMRPIPPAAPEIRETPNWTQISAPAMPKTLGGRKLDPAEIFETAGKSVYVVLAARTHQDLRELKDVSQASAVAIAPDTLITNCHAVRERPVILVSQEGKFMNAALFRTDPETDRCFLRMLEGGVTPVAGVRDYETLKVGERVYTIGSPRGLQRTLGEGLISGLRARKGLKLVQTGAPASPGSSGGGLFDAQGNLVGITSFALGGGEQMNFAIAASEYWR